MELFEKKWFQIIIKWMILGVFLMIVISWSLEIQRLPEYVLLEVKSDHYVILKVNNQISSTKYLETINYPRER